MTIESKPATQTHPSGSAHAMVRATAGPSSKAPGGQGFAGLVSALAAQDGSDVSLSDLAQPAVKLADEEENMPLALDKQAQDDTNLIANIALQSAALPSLTTVELVPEVDATPATLPVALVAPLSPARTTSLSASALKLAPGPVPQPLFNAETNASGAVASATVEMRQRAVTDEAPPDVATGQSKSNLPAPDMTAPELTAKSLLPSKGSDAKPVSMSASAQAEQSSAVLPEPGKTVVLPLPVAELARPAAEGSKGKRLAGQGVADGVAAVPAWIDRSGISGTYAIVEASAVVPDTQLAETVSYWVTHGVQKAELTLDGLGSEPVEVQISVDGDQTRVDFRTSQVEVRQAIEGAAGQLKGLLASEGLQLLGLSVGTSAKGNTAGDGRQGRPALVRPANVVGVPTVAAAPGRVANTAVGRALDLYV